MGSFCLNMMKVTLSNTIIGECAVDKNNLITQLLSRVTDNLT